MACLSVLEEVIVELRGNGVVLTVYELELKTLELLKQKAAKFGEDLAQAWFDPFFWHPKDMQQLKSQIKKKQEYRGLMCDDISFIEIRRKGKKRKKYLVKELLGEGQLFPMVGVSPINHSQLMKTKDTIATIELATGCLARFSINATDGALDLSVLQTQVFTSSPIDLEVLFFEGYKSDTLYSQYDDYLFTRRQLLNS